MGRRTVEIQARGFIVNPSMGLLAQIVFQVSFGLLLSSRSSLNTIAHEALLLLCYVAALSAFSPFHILPGGTIPHDHIIPLLSGTCDLYVDFQDSPDRYYISKMPQPDLGLRRLTRFAGYPATQYFILEKVVVSDALESEGGSGLTVRIERGPFLFMEKGWKLVGSFFAFEKEMYGSNQYSVYTRDDPFPRVNVAIGPISHEDEWTLQHQFYAFDIALAGTCVLTLQHCVRSIYNASANVSRHRLTMEDPRMPWEFRMHIYAFPADLEDCSLTDEPVENGQKIQENAAAPKS